MATLKRGASRLHFTSPRRIGEGFVRDADELVFAADDFAQVNILNRIMRFRHRPGAARTIDFGLLHSGSYFFALANIAFDSVEPGSEQQTGIVALHGVDVGSESVSFIISAAEVAVAFGVQSIGVV